MPTYDFRCPEGHVTERSIYLGDGGGPPSSIPCPSCTLRGIQADRVFSKPHVPLLGDDSMHRRRRRPMTTDKSVADGGKARKRL